jgi:hypothetical protein
MYYITDMELRPKRKALFLTLAVCIVFSVVFAEVLIAGEHEHDCIGEGCPFCLLIETANNFLKSLKLTALTVFFSFSFLYGSLLIAHCSLFTTHSPVTLKVRFNT